MVVDYCDVLQGMRPVAGMVLSQASAAGINVFYKLAVAQGMNMSVLVAYRFIFATAFVAPIAFFLERNSRPKLTWIIVFQGFLTGLFGGSMGQNLYIESLALTSATFAAAMTNLIPAFTFLLAILFGLETLEIRNWDGKSKVVGTVVGIAGAMVLTFYKGGEVEMWSTNINLVRDDTTLTQHHVHVHVVGDQILGSLFALASCLSYASWMITQHSYDVWLRSRTVHSLCLVDGKRLVSMETRMEYSTLLCCLYGSNCNGSYGYGHSMVRTGKGAIIYRLFHAFVPRFCGRAWILDLRRKVIFGELHWVCTNSDGTILCSLGKSGGEEETEPISSGRYNL